jgi:DNA-binding transcriptional LysR family regulator
MIDAGRLSLQHLHCLVVLVEEGHVTRAAEKVGVTQPAMSTILARLRQVFQDPILVRTTTGMQPTPRALELTGKAKIALELVSGAGGSAEPFDPGRAEHHFRIMASEGVAELIVPELMARLHPAAPRLRFTVQSGDIRRSAEYLRDGEVDFVMAFTQRKLDELYQMLLYPQSIVCLVSREHSDIGESLSLEQYLAQGHVVWGADPVPYPALEALVEKALLELGVSRRVAIKVPSPSISAAIVARTDLLAAVPRRMARRPDIAACCRALPLPFPVSSFDVQLMWHARWHREPTHAWVRQLLRQVAKDLQSQLA